MTSPLNRLKILLPAAVLLLAASSQWYRFQAGRWELATDAGERRAAALLRQTAEAAALLENVAPELKPAPGAAAEPPRMVLFSSGRDFAPFRRGSGHSGLLIWSGGQSLMLLADAGVETVRAARHELVHWMLRRRQFTPPRWLEEGLADYYSTLEFDGRSARLGRSPRGHMELLRSRPWMTAAALARVGRADAESAVEVPELFYPQSWALVRWMMIEGGGPARVVALLERMEQGRSLEAAFQEVLGISMNEALARAQRMADRIPADAAPDGRPAPAPVLPGEVLRTALPDPAPAVLRAECLLAAGLEGEAERLATEVLRRHPKDADAHTLAGMLALRRREFAQARSHLEQAIALGDDSARVHFEYAMLVRDTGGPDALVEQGLRRAVAGAPEFAEAWLVLGNWLLGKGRPAEAAEALERAAALEPQRSVAWEALGRARLALGDRERARQAAARAALTAARPQDTEMAQALLREIETRPAAPLKPKSAVETPAGWKPREGDAQVSGRLVEIDCSGPTLRFRIEVKPRTARTPAESVILETDKPNLVMLRGKTAGRREFICGAQQPAPEVTAGYVSAPGPATAAPQEAPPPAPAAPAAPKKSAGSRSSKRTPARPAPKTKPAPPKQQPTAGELVWLEFR
ncbi:MAG: tetratricopeptide repeat protein [Bryobacteraceae bacterium]